MTRRPLGLLLLGLLMCGAATVQAQTVIDPTSPTAGATLTSADHLAVFTQAEVTAANASPSLVGQPKLTSYGATLFLASVDVGAPGVAFVASSGIIPKTAMVAVPPSATVPPNTYRLPVNQWGFTIPPCTVVAPATCPVYTVVFVASGPGGSVPWSTDGESNPFTLAPRVIVPLARPAGPGNVKVPQ